MLQWLIGLGVVVLIVFVIVWLINIRKDKANS
jgi:uncharacterized membrane protein YqiK